MNRPTPTQVHAAAAAIRQKIRSEHPFYNNMISDDELQDFATAGLIAALNVQPTKDSK